MLSEPVQGDSPIAAPPLTAIILAGGASRRMGQDKALLPVQGVPLLRRVCDVALACTPVVWIVTPWPARYRAIVPPAVQFVLESDSETLRPGPLVGFAQGLAAVATEWTLLLACDLPRLEATILQGWQQYLAQVELAAIAALLPSDRGWEPLCGFYRQSCRDRLTAYLAQGGRSFQGWLAQAVVQPLPLSAAATVMLLNCNTPADYARLE